MSEMRDEVLFILRSIHAWSPCRCVALARFGVNAGRGAVHSPFHPYIFLRSLSRSARVEIGCQPQRFSDLRRPALRSSGAS
jgi:hypothetical protein